MYINLELLYVLYEFLFPLNYHRGRFIFTHSVYSPITKESINVYRYEPFI